MKKLYILLLFTFGFKLQASFCKELNVDVLTGAQEYFEIQKAYNTLSPVKGETANVALVSLLRAYKEGMPYMQYVSEKEKNKQIKKIIEAHDVLKKHRLDDKSPEEIKVILARRLSPEQFIYSSNKHNDDDSYEVIDQACAYSPPYDQQDKFEESAISRGTSFYSCSQNDQMRNENLSLSSNDFLGHEGEKRKFNSIEEALNILHLTRETYAIEFIQYQISFFELENEIGSISAEEFQLILEAANFLISNID